MRCPKCGYVSFDYNQTCPKCSKDISAEIGKMGLTHFKPEPPSLLGALTGEANESHVGLELDTSSSFTGTDEMEAGLGDSQDLEMPEMEIGEERESADFSADEESLDDDLDMDLDDSGAFDDDTLDFDGPVSPESDQDDSMDLNLDIGEEPEGDKPGIEEPLSEEAAQEDDVLDFDLDDSIEEASDADQPISAQSGRYDSLELDLNAISLDEDEMAKLEVDEEVPESAEATPDEETVSAGTDEAGLGESAMIELNLDDLKIDKTGQLEIKDQAQFSEGLKKVTAKKGKPEDKKANGTDINLKIDDDDLNLDLEKLDLEIDIEKPENKIL